jgi:NitT/TauT family transport system substrate-binding protein
MDARKRWIGLAAMGAVLVAGSTAARAEAKEITIGYQFGLSYLPLMVMDEKDLFEKHAKATGLESKATFITLGGPGFINDGLLSGNLQFGAVGVPSLVNLWAKTAGSLNVKAVGALNSMPMFLNTVNPNVKTLKDFTEKDKISLPTAKISVQAITLQMAVAKEFGQDQFNKLDRFCVSMSHPDSMTALLSGASEVTAHFGSPPFQYRELGNPKVRKVLNSYDVLGGPSTFTLVVGSGTFRDANPKTYAAFVSAFQEAQDWINQNKKEAAELYVKFTNSKEPLDEVQKQLGDPDIEYTLTPKNVMKYADFMFKVGSIKRKAESWKDLAHPNLHTLPGS